MLFRISPCQGVLSASVLWALGAAVLLPAAQARGNLTIVPLFDSTLTSDPAFADIQAGVNAAIDLFHQSIANDLTIPVIFSEAQPGDLGASSTRHAQPTYDEYVSALQTQQHLSANDVKAIASLPPGPNNPVDGNSRLDVNLPLAVALNVVSPDIFTQFPSLTPQVWLNTSIMNLKRTGDQYPDRYDLQTTAEHELDEVLGIGGGGSSASAILSDLLPAELDLFRYNAPGSRVYHGSYPPSGDGIAYFSIDGGVTNIINFNGMNSDGDGGDWAGINGVPQVQDFTGTPGAQPDLALSELTALDVAGWDLAVPEPTSMSILCIAATAVLPRRRRR